MVEQKALSMAEFQQKLRELEKHLPGQQEMVYQFGDFVAGRLNQRLLPQGFVMVCELAIYDLQEGVSGFSGKPINNRLVGSPPLIYALMRMFIPVIAEAVFPAEFAAEVKQFIEAVNERV